MEPEVLTKIEKVDPVAAEESPHLDVHNDEVASPGLSDHGDAKDAFSDNESLFEELLDGEDETYDHVQGRV